MAVVAAVEHAGGAWDDAAVLAAGIGKGAGVVAVVGDDDVVERVDTLPRRQGDAAADDSCELGMMGCNWDVLWVLAEGMAGDERDDDDDAGVGVQVDACLQRRLLRKLPG